jgi:hypothetical protein
MADYPFIPGNLYPVWGTGPETTNGAKVCDYVSLKNAHRCYVVIQYYTSVGHATAITIEKATDVAMTATTAITASVPIWYANVSTTNSKLIRQTDAVSFTMDVGVTGYSLIIFEIDPASLGAFDCITCKAASSAQANNFWSVTYWMAPRYASKPSTMSATEYIVD